MDKAIKVSMQLTQKDEFVSIPVRYTTKQENELATVYDCTVDLPTNEIPEWLMPNVFSIRKVNKGSFTKIGVNSNKLGSPDAGLFATAVADQIRVREINEKTW